MKNLYKAFDHIGVVIWLLLIADSINYIYRGSPDWRVYLRLITGIGGLLVDGYLVFIYKEGGRRHSRKKVR